MDVRSSITADFTSLSFHFTPSIALKNRKMGNILIYIYYRFRVRFPIGLYFIFITFTFILHLLLSWTSSLSISGSAISASTLSNHVFLGLQPVFCLQLYTPYISSPSPHHLFSSHVHTISVYHF